MKPLCVFAIVLAPAPLLALVPRFAQPLSYHAFADQRCLLCVPHLWNVVSNLPFFLLGLWGLWIVARADLLHRLDNARDRWFYGLFFAAVALTGIGSAYYHADPTNDRLLWDRLPLAIAFMALFALVLAERIHYPTGVLLFFPLVIVGGGSVIYWHVTEAAGQGDLRPYLLVQLYPLVAIPAILVLFPARWTDSENYFAALACYLVAKALELLDSEVYAQGQIVSGHTLKHLFAALGVYFILHMLQRRRLRQAPISASPP